ncbi:MAG: AAA family ATPase, partial [Gemmatimonadetes bacterium]|nr:AAA family ATPase [Gemmatimonadota bacterium]
MRSFVPIDRALALAAIRELPDRVLGAALFADLSGFTELTGILAQELGAKRGAEELLTHLNAIYEGLVAVVHDAGGSVVGFSGDAITCWFDATDGALDLAAHRAVTAALRLHEVVRARPATITPAGAKVPFALKVGVTSGPARRFAAGDPARCRLDTLAGDTLARVAAAERVAVASDTIVDDATRAALGSLLQTAPRHTLPTGDALWVVESLRAPAAPAPWPPLPGGAWLEAAGDWVLPAVAERLMAGEGFLGELRPAIPLFIGFEGIDWDRDPEAGQRLDAFVRWAQATVSNLGGDIIQLTVGDKGSNLYAAFGAPLAHEDDADRASAAALALLDPPASAGGVRDVKIGMTMGQVFAGACGARAHRCYSVMGDPVNLAARLLGRARAGEALAASPLVRAAVRHSFGEFVETTVRGRAEPVPVASLRGRREVVASRSTSVGATLIGRDEELGLLLPLVDAAGQGTGHTVLLEGEAGIGKSSLATVVAARAAAMGLSTYIGTAEAVQRSRPYHAWRPIFAQLLGVTATGDQERQRAAVLDRIAALDPALASRVPLLEAVCDLGFAPTPLTAQMDAAVRAENTRELLVRLLLELAPGSRVLVLEDVHWFDSASWSLVSALRRRGIGTLMVLAARPLADAFAGSELPADVRDLLADPHLVRLALRTLGAPDVAALACQRLGVDALPSPVARLIADRAEGNPLFVEELSKALLEAGLLVVDGRRCRMADGVTDDAAAAFPVTLEGLVTSRLDRLTPAAQRTAKVASVIGRRFLDRTLDAVYPVAQERDRLPQSLEELDQRHIIAAVADVPAHAFRHAVTHEVVYGSLLYAQRRDLHRAVANWMEQAHGDNLTPHLSALAHHWEAAESPAEALRYGELAGEQALESFANQEAARYFTRVLRYLAASHEDLASRGEYQLRRARALRRLGRATYALDDMQSTATHLREALALLGHPLPESPVRLGALLVAGLLREGVRRFRPRRETPPADQAERIEAAGAISTMILTYFFTGNLMGAVAGNFLALDLAEGACAGPALTYELAVSNANVGAVFRNAFGMSRAANRYFARAEQVAREAAHLPAMGYVEQIRGMVSFLSGDAAAAGAPLERAADIYHEVGDRRRWEESTYSLGTVHLMRGALESARAASAAVVTSGKARDSLQGVILALAQLGHVLVVQGRLDDAVQALEESRTMPSRQELPAERLYAAGALAVARAMQGGAAFDIALQLVDEATALARRLPMSNIAVDGYALATEAAL